MSMLAETRARATDPITSHMAAAHAARFAGSHAARVARFDMQERERLEAERQRIAAEERAKAQAEAALAAAQQEKSNVVPDSLDAGVLDLGGTTPTPTFAPVPEDGHQAPDVAQQAPAPATQATAPATLSDEPTLNLSAINARLSPLSISGSGLAEFGIEPLATDKSARLYSEVQFSHLLAAISAHVVQLARKHSEAAEQLEAA